jgi:hypothetical protein
MIRICSSVLGLVLVAIVAVGCGGKNDGSGDPDASTTTDSDETSPDADVQEGIMCGAAICDEATQECCVDDQGGQACAAIGECTGTVFGCDGPEDCPVEGEICCGMGEGAHCQAANTCLADVVCHVDDDCPTEGDKCCPVTNTLFNRCLRVAMCPQ